jgi:hypothetical protein
MVVAVGEVGGKLRCQLLRLSGLFLDLSLACSHISVWC